MNDSELQETWTLRTLGLSSLVPIRVRNVIRLNWDDPVLQLDLPEASRRLSELESFLRGCRSVSEHSSSLFSEVFC